MQSNIYAMTDKLHNLTEGIKELEAIIHSNRREGKPTQGKELLLMDMYMMKCELLEKAGLQQPVQ
ncbi:hypothetical protein [Foetidibacter luteolus]|uniref:hypothetical protein n=1 Tax=Foetidibacter luteolus TaxID=2608880 RepID=UPI00129BC235|nr:hypothetical protein [Foetidibacter luteolus]